MERERKKSPKPTVTTRTVAPGEPSQFAFVPDVRKAAETLMLSGKEPGYIQGVYDLLEQILKMTHNIP